MILSKGQVEFVVLFGLIVMAAVLIILALQFGILKPPFLSEEHRSVSDSVEDLIRAGTLDTLATLSATGGSLTAPAIQSVTFQRAAVAYWQLNGNFIHPSRGDIEANLVTGIEQYLQTNTPGLEQALADRGVEIGEPQVTATIFDDRIELSVFLPTTVDGTPIPQPYALSVPTRFGQIVDFAESFTSFERDNRLLETYTLGTMFGFLPPENGIPPVPYYLLLTECGQFVHLNWFDVKANVEQAVRLTLGHTYLPRKSPLNVGDTSSFPKWAVPPIAGKDYAELDVTFHLPDGFLGPGSFELSRADFQFTPEPISLFARPIPFTGACISDSDNAYINYFLTYPVVVRVTDPVTGIRFRFANTVYIKDNEPGDWAQVVSYDSTVQTDICSEPFCTVDLAVANRDGVALEAAAISFMGCPLGQTDSQGRLVAPAPCGSGTFTVSKQSYGTHTEFNKDITELGDVVLEQRPVFNMKFYEVVVSNDTLSRQYIIAPIGVSELNADREDNNFAFLEFVPESVADSDFASAGGNSKSITVNYINPGRYNVSGELRDAEGRLLGAFATSVEIIEEMDSEDLYVYLPKVYLPGSPFAAPEDSSQVIFDTLLYSQVLAECDLGPLSLLSPEGFETCAVSYDELS